MLDFTSALYLGQGFATSNISSGIPLTTGKPAALCETGLNKWVAQKIAKMQGMERGIIAPSALHLFWDIFGMTEVHDIIFIDAAAYPISEWGSIRAISKQIQVIKFKAHDSKDLHNLLKIHCKKHQKPIIICDGWSIDLGKISPLKEYLFMAKKYDGKLLLDDTQAFGIFGKKPTAHQVFGVGGGGSLAHLGLYSPRILSIVSLSKSFGVPVSVLSGNAENLKKFTQKSDTRIHTSQVSNLYAISVANVLKINQLYGNLLRNKLLKNILFFQQILAKNKDIQVLGGLFPVQQIVVQNSHFSPQKLHTILEKKGIESLLLAPLRQFELPRIGFCIRADHTANELLKIAEIL